MVNIANIITYNYLFIIIIKCQKKYTFSDTFYTRCKITIKIITNNKKATYLINKLLFIILKITIKIISIP